MKNQNVLRLLLLVLTLCLSDNLLADAVVGTQAPYFKHAIGSSDGYIELGKQHAKQPTVIFFLSTWCHWYLKDSEPEMASTCVATRESLKKFHQANKHQGQVIGVVSRLWTTQKEIKEYDEKFKLGFPLLLDKSNKIFYAYQVKHIPSVIVLDRNGIIRHRATGNIGDINSLLASLNLP